MECGVGDYFSKLVRSVPLDDSVFPRQINSRFLQDFVGFLLGDGGDLREDFVDDCFNRIFEGFFSFDNGFDSSDDFIAVDLLAFLALFADSLEIVEVLGTQPYVGFSEGFLDDTFAPDTFPALFPPAPVIESGALVFGPGSGESKIM